MNRARTAVCVAMLGLGLTACGSQRAHRSPVTDPSASHPDTSTASAYPTSAPPPPALRAAAGTLPAHPTSAVSAACAAERGWGSGPQAGSAASSPAALYLVRAGEHACYDRVVFDLNGPEAVGYTVRYVAAVRADADGSPVPVQGRAALEVVVLGPIYGTDHQGHQPWLVPPTVGQDFVAPAKVVGWASLAEVRYAGSSQGRTTFAVGVRQTRPFRVLVSSERYYRHVILDIAH